MSDFEGERHIAQPSVNGSVLEALICMWILGCGKLCPQSFKAQCSLRIIFLCWERRTLKSAGNQRKRLYWLPKALSCQTGARVMPKEKHG